MDGRLFRKSQRIALNGILIALAVIVLWAATIVPTGRLSLFALSSFFVSIIISEYGAASGWAFFAASSLLALTIIPSKMEVLPYIIFFGIYGIIKFHIERLRTIILEYVLKVLYFNLSLWIMGIFLRKFLLDGIRMDFPWWIVVIALEAAFLVYDYVYTLFIRYYRENIRKLLRI